ncbi:class I SAM-dependent methyltransferase [Hanstruepera marina]|uniref:class I SAM-dependent methyltransferase n=1 Tax=Hanstruepera marina TaxID=2873265 RepID=UPI001CA6E377|nr:class I SAM-dependent methyltransferase [Hanstruepera marina]
MNNALLNKEYQDYINANLNSDIQSLILNPRINPPFDFKDLILQIESKKKCEKKLPTWFNSENIYYPNKLNIEQTSSEITAKYKSQLVSGKRLIDITGGFGVDAFYFSKVIDQVIHCEISNSLTEIVAHNFKVLQVKNIKTVSTDGLKFLEESDLVFNWVYIDPSRRHDTKGKVFYMKDCLPNVPENLDGIFSKCSNILIKTSPLLDLSVGQNELKHIKEIHIVALDNEVKELLWVLQKDYSGHVEIKTINCLRNENQLFRFNYDQEKDATANYSIPQKYLYEPNSAILKSGAFNLISTELNLYKLHQHSHLYTSNDQIKFPGRTFAIKTYSPYNKETMKRFKNLKANISIRNFPEPVKLLRTKYKIKDGGNLYLFFTTDLNEKRIVIECEKLN